YLSERDWQIPITLTEPIRREAQSLTLYVSSDLGRTWKKEATAKPTDEFFKYVAPGDGNYWFSVSFVNKAGQTIPAKESDLQPQLKITVDTKRPEVKLQVVERQGEMVTVSWEARDDHLDASSLMLQYRAKGDNAWKAVNLSTGAQGKKQFATGSMAAIEVRVLARDLAGNQGEDLVEAAATTIISSNQVSPPVPSLTTSQGTSTPPAGGSSVPMLPPAPPLGGAGSSGAPALTIPNLPAVDGTLPPPAVNPTPPAFGTPANSVNNTLPNPATPATGNTMKTFDNGFKPAGMVPQANSAPTSTNAAFLRGVQWTNSQHLDLDFDVKAGPSGVGVLELYYTLDAGKTWQLLDKREEADKPFSVDVPGEGIYGFTMVVKNKAGLGRQAPQSGEMPEVRIGVDITPPVCELVTPLEPVPGRKDLINIKWQAMDANLASGPVKLEWAESPSGPWQEIVKNQPNTGSFPWRVPQNTPYQVYLKIEVTDVAGNIGQFITQEPVLVDLQMPEVKMKGLISPRKQ
ncbi:MAG TPA: hypothetical protein PKA06_07620, partial [Gemmatales bacterium]|nr:hypothetical protein [Gemmatales bacterium]